MARGLSSKLCAHCHQLLPLSDFYPNKQWKQQLYRDSWCRECALEYCTDKEKLQQYCYENNRLYRDTCWDGAEKKAQVQLASNPKYCDKHTPVAEKREILNRTIVKNYFSLMNLSNSYVFVDNMGDGEAKRTDHPSRKNNKSEKMEYDKVWRGYYTPTQVESLNEIYARYEEDFVLDNINIQDYARKIAKASLNADVAEDRMRRGEGSYQEYKEAQKIFDDLSKSTNFAACKRKAGESTGLGSLGEIILRLETSGELSVNGFTFPEDDVDKIIHDFEHTLRAVGVEGQL